MCLDTCQVFPPETGALRGLGWAGLPPHHWFRCWPAQPGAVIDATSLGSEVLGKRTPTASGMGGRASSFTRQETSRQATRRPMARDFGAGFLASANVPRGPPSHSSSVVNFGSSFSSPGWNALDQLGLYSASLRLCDCARRVFSIEIRWLIWRTTSGVTSYHSRPATFELHSDR